MSIKEATEYNYGYDRMAGKKKYIWPTLISILRIHSLPQSFGTKTWLLFLKTSFIKKCSS